MSEASMHPIALVLVAAVAVEHVAFLVMEMFFWTTPRTRAAFNMSLEKAQITAALAKNQGLYNGFLAGGLFWSLLADSTLARPVATFFLGCVVIAGLFGSITASRRIFWIQAVPAAAALVAVRLLMPG